MGAKVTHITSVHSAHDPRILYKECKSLSAAGFQVSLVAPHTQSEVADGVSIRPVPVPATRAERAAVTIRRVFRAAVKEDADIYHFHDPELISVAWMLKRRGKRVIYDVHEEVPKQIMSKAWIPRFMRKRVAGAVNAVESWASGWLDGIVAATPVIASRFPASKTIAVNNYPILGSARPDVAERRSSEAPALVAYVGNITRERGVFELMRGVASLRGRMDVRLVMAGKFVTPELQQEAEQNPAWSCVDFRGWCSRDEVWRLLSESTVGAVTLLPSPRYLDSQPVKMYEYMAAGVPVVASDFPLWRSIVEEAGCGVLADPTNPESLAAAIADVIVNPVNAQAMGRRGREAVETQYNWGVEAAALVGLYESLLGASSRGCAGDQSHWNPRSAAASAA